MSKGSQYQSSHAMRMAIRLLSEVNMSYFGSQFTSGSVRAKHAGNLSPTALSVVAGYAWLRSLKKTSDTSGPLAYSGTHRFYFDT